MPNHTELLELLLKNRGIKEEDWDKFLNPSYDNDLYDPFLMKGMELATVRIFEAIEAKEKIVIYSDYDCDGIPAAVIFSDFLNKIKYNNFSVYIPNRNEEGYGLHQEALNQFKEDGVKLLITFDLGITAISPVSDAMANGIDVIITDHHLPRISQDNTNILDIKEIENVLRKEDLPKAYAILNPKQSGCNYPDKMLCGAGISFKLVSALIKKYGEYWKISNGWEKWLLDMAGVATLSDQVPLINENRVLAFYGLKVLRKSRRPGVTEIFKLSNVDIKNLNEDDIAFTLAPKINAASRMSDPKEAFDLLSTNDFKTAKTLALNLSKINDNRKQSVAHIMKEVKSTLLKRGKLDECEKPLIVIGNPNWNIGILGIVASKIVDEYKKTVFVWGSSLGGVIKGSGRAFSEVNLVEILSLLPEGSLLDFGGHKGACGFSIKEEEIHFLEDKLISIYEKKIKDIPEKEFLAEAQITIDDVTEDNFKVIEKLSPYGMGNPKPIFLLKNIIIDDLKEFGKDKNHLELSFKNSKNKIVKAIAFFKTRDSYKKVLEKGLNIDMIATFEKNTFANKKEIRLRINDIMIK